MRLSTAVRASIALLGFCLALPGWDDGGLVGNNVIHLAGRGKGTLTRNGSPGQPLLDVSVDIDRGGKILVSFRTDRKQPVTFSGSVIDSQPDMLKADVASDDPARLRGSMYFSRSAQGAITRISLEATNGQEHLQVEWKRR